MHFHQALVAACGEQRRLVHQIGQIGAGHARRAARDDLGMHVRRDRHLAHVDVQDLLAAADIGQRHRPGGRNGRDAAGPDPARRDGWWRRSRSRPGCFETIHLDQHLVQRLLALVVAAAQAGATLAADRVDLVDEDDAGRVLLGLLEHVAHARRAHADEHFDEVRAGNGEERHLGFARDGSGQQRLAGARRAHHQHAARNASAELLEFGGIPQEFDQLGTSSLASSQPATSANVTCCSISSSMRALLLPKENARRPCRHPASGA